MRYFFSNTLNGNYSELVDGLIALKLGKIIGLDNKEITIKVDSSNESEDFYKLFICGILTRGSNAYVIRNENDEFFKYVINNSKSSLGIKIEYSEHFIISFYDKISKELDNTLMEEIEYLLDKEISFPLGCNLGKILNYEHLKEEYMNN